MEASPASPVQLRRDGSVVWLTINRPEAQNALDPDTVQALLAEVEMLAAQHQTRVVVFIGAGHQAFSAGGDAAALHGLNRSEVAAWLRLGHRLTEAVAALPQPTIAVLNGVAAGSGCALALATDLRVMAAGARLGLPDVQHGLIPPWGATQRLARLVGPSVAKELVYTGRYLAAAEALRLGLVNAVHPDHELLGATQALAQRLATQPPAALGAVKAAVDSGLNVDLATANQIEAAIFERLVAGADAGSLPDSSEGR